MANTFRATIDGGKTIDLEPDSCQNLDLVPDGPGRFHLLDGLQPYRVEVLEASPARKFYRISIDGRAFDVQLADDLDLQVERMGFRAEQQRGVSRVEAPMPGLILALNINQGDAVRKGDQLLVLEAMKMENAILSPADGVIARIAVSEGDAVDKRALLVEFE